MRGAGPGERERMIRRLCATVAVLSIVGAAIVVAGPAQAATSLTQTTAVAKRLSPTPTPTTTGTSTVDVELDILGHHLRHVVFSG
ncbi:hypothetical protein [Cellulomonas sp. URHD0024]|uniref:hypothetical protein n=1 Tax=Cellulomonas sp. URHD0024 TaxID=1302620 RepID=UPI0012DDA9B8|nr:hypothetical protein [Cellulomonas sp. URHD0024]